MDSQPLNLFQLRTCAAVLVLTSAIGCSGGAADMSVSNTLIDSTEPNALNALNDSSEQIPELDVNSTSILTGTFIDGTIEGLSYITNTQTGITNNRGEFTYTAGDSITFSIGALLFPTVAAAEVITPFQLAMESDNPLSTTLNIARLLQSLDNDGIRENGISIAEEAAFMAGPVNFDVSPLEFENNPVVINLMANSGSVTTALISSSDVRYQSIEPVD